MSFRPDDRHYGSAVTTSQTANQGPEERVEGALRRLVKNKKFLELDFAALERGREALRKDDDYLWGV